VEGEIPRAISPPLFSVRVLTRPLAPPKMPSGEIAIVCERFDPHADFIIRKLRHIGHDPIRLNLDELAEGASLNMSFPEGASKGTIKTKHFTFDQERIRSIWWRKPKAFGRNPSLPGPQSKFANMEFSHFFGGMWQTMECYWISKPERIRNAVFKPEQISRAARFGFEVPRTCFTNDPEAAMSFYEQCGGNIIFKVMSDPSLGISGVGATFTDAGEPPSTFKAVFATPMSAKDLKENGDQIRMAPCQFQEYIPKEREFRITVIGDEVFVAAIDSQSNERTKIDWRHYDVPMKISKGVLPEEIADRCVRLVKSYGLNYSTMDVILTPDGRYVFLENNPNGQWLFIEEKVPELRLSDALISCLINGKPELFADREYPIKIDTLGTA